MHILINPLKIGIIYFDLLDIIRVQVAYLNKAKESNFMIEEMDSCASMISSINTGNNVYQHTHTLIPLALEHFLDPHTLQNML